MASWAPPPRQHRPWRRPPQQAHRAERGVLRLGRHVVPDRDLVLLAERLGEIERRLSARAREEANADHERGALRKLARDRVAGDLELLTAALERSRLSSH